MNLLLELFYIFARIGLFTFGGGYAMIAIIEDICVERKKWVTHEEMMNMTVIAESTPGPIAINCATYVGYKLAGFVGATVATFGMVLPSFIVIFAISKFLDNFLEIQVIANAFQGIKIAVGILIFDAAITMIKKMKKKILPRTIMISAFLVMMLANIFSWTVSSIHLVNLATYIGSAKAGFAGAAAATFAVVLPAFLIIILITALLKNVINNPYMQAVLMGLKPCVTGIILATGCYMLFHNCVKEGISIAVSGKAVILTVILFGIKYGYQHLKKKKMLPIVLIAISAVTGIFIYGI